MHKSATKCNETLGKWCKNKHGASKIIDTLETFHPLRAPVDDIDTKELSWRCGGNRSAKRKSEGAREWGKPSRAPRL
jgi:hypothetical protein